jgi:hypothetical protein
VQRRVAPIMPVSVLCDPRHLAVAAGEVASKRRDQDEIIERSGACDPVRDAPGMRCRAQSVAALDHVSSRAQEGHVVRRQLLVVQSIQERGGSKKEPAGVVHDQSAVPFDQAEPERREGHATSDMSKSARAGSASATRRYGMARPFFPGIGYDAVV